MSQTAIDKTLEHLFRHEYGSIVAGLTARFGSERVEEVEDAVQEALFKAMRLWSYSKIPGNPGGWLYRTAFNHMIDQLRRQQQNSAFGFNQEESFESFEPRDSATIQDEQLRMIFACCNPSLKEKNSLMLSLKLLGGFSVTEIARAFLIKEEAAKKSLQRAKKEFKANVKDLDIPAGQALQTYRERVLKVIYLIFTEGYKASDGDTLIKEDLCGESLRLALLLTQKDFCRTPELYSLISLICFKVARFQARINQDGELVLLENQDRSLYQPEYIRWAYYYFSQATNAKRLSSYYLEAAIEFQYHAAPSFAGINWKKLLYLHEQLMNLKPGATSQLHYLIVYQKVYGAQACLKKLKRLEAEMKDNHLYQAFLADTYSQTGQQAEAVTHLNIALQKVRNNIERQYLQKKMARLKQAIEYN